jgi:copper(I)-binding protein
MKPIKTFIAVLFVYLFLMGTVFADEDSTIITENLRVILPPSVARSTSAYGVIKNKGSSPVTLINVSSNAAGMVMLHKTDIKDGMAEMNHIERYVIDAGAELVLKPMSYHLMFVNINHDIIKESSTVNLILEFEKIGKISFKLPVLAE